MLSTRSLVSVVLAAIAAIGFFSAAQSAGSPAAPEPKVTPLMSQPLPESPGKEALMLLVEYPPGAVEHKHRHDAHAFVYVLEGNIVLGVQGQPEVPLGPGQTFHEGPNDIHTVGRNASKTEPAKFVVVLLKDKGKPVLTPLE